MKKILFALSLAVVLAGASAPSYATGFYGFGPKSFCHWFPFWPGCKKPDEKPHHPKPDQPEVHSVPEIDGANAGLALALMGGICAIARERRRRQNR